MAFALPNDLPTSWLKIPTSARAAAMGGAFGAVGNDVESLEVNPAGLADIQTSQLELMQSFWAQDLSLQHLVYGQALSRDSGGAIAADLINFGQVNEYVIEGDVPVSSGSYSPMAFTLTTGYAKILAADFQAGATAKFLFQNIQGPSSATVAMDAGVLWRIPKAGMSFALAVNNFGGTLDTADLPLQVNAATAFQTRVGNGVVVDKAGISAPAHLVTLAADGDINLRDTGFSNFRMGGEYWYHQQIAARIGYRWAPYGDLSGTAGFSVGAGIRYQKWELSYALTTQGDMGSTNQISLMTGF